MQINQVGESRAGSKSLSKNDLKRDAVLNVSKVVDLRIDGAKGSHISGLEILSMMFLFIGSNKYPIDLRP